MSNNTPNGMHLPEATPPKLSRHIRVVDRMEADRWDMELRSQSIAGIAAEEARAASDAYEEYDTYTSDHFGVLADDWLERAVEREAAAIAAFVDAGTEPPKNRVSEVDKASRERPLALATARRMKERVYQLDAAALRVFAREAPGAVPALRDGVQEALAAVERALAEVARTAAIANAAYGELVKVRQVAENLPPFIMERLAIPLMDQHASTVRLHDELQAARRRVGGQDD
ncbi:hypothetical protein J4573_52905 [Actinomadura barringtoniae]|uniref:Uncharacterized protein n=1 Tax=Actinomadura barringtoniae TaxID=1427535 RepID=A0A939TAV5_9ACTN|nr:hypothetical protein [Actinomadura barringtoniae]MBO2455859.1 hypothetical protein [Actinomadura barringtoniae]